MLDQHADETLDGAENRALDHHRALLGSGARGVRKLEALGQIVIELNRRNLPSALQSVGHVDLNLGTVERAFLGIYLELYLVAEKCGFQFMRRQTPLFFAAEMMIGHGRELEIDVLESERPVHVAHHLEI